LRRGVAFVGCVGCFGGEGECLGRE
jgi:hypothetical protein